MTAWGARWKTEHSQRVWVHMNFFPKLMWVGVINFTFILVDEMSLFWIFSGCDVKPHLAKAGPSGPRQCLPALRLNTPRYSSCFWAGTEILRQTKIKRKNVLQWQFWVWGQTASWDEMKATETDQSSERRKCKGPELQAPALSGLILHCSSPWNLCHLQLQKQEEI